MAEKIKKFLDQEGVKHLWSKINMNDYPNNETLMAVINAIDETKADKSELIQNITSPLSDELQSQARTNIGAIGYDWHQVPYSSSYVGIHYAANVPGYTFMGVADWDAVLTPLTDNGVLHFYQLVASIYLLFTGDDSTIWKNVVSKIIKSFPKIVETGGLVDSSGFAIAISNNRNKIVTVLIGYNSMTDTYMAMDIATNNRRRITFTPDGTILYNSIYDVIDDTLTAPWRPADAKAVGDALAQKANKSELVQSDWNQNDETATNYIKNKPSLATSEEIKALFN